MNNTFLIKTYAPHVLLFPYIMLFANCGKHESSAGTVGTASGALIGASIAGKRDKATGAIIGGLIGNVVGTSIGRASDDEEREQEREWRERHHARERQQHQQTIQRIQEENERLRERRCNDCGRRVSLQGARSCPACGGQLIQKRICSECRSSFSPTSGYRYCPYCKEKTRLINR